MLLDFPWFNFDLGEYFFIYEVDLPLSYPLFYPNLSFGCTQLISLCLFLLLLVVGLTALTYLWTGVPIYASEKNTGLSPLAEERLPKTRAYG